MTELVDSSESSTMDENYGSMRMEDVEVWKIVEKKTRKPASAKAASSKSLPSSITTEESISVGGSSKSSVSDPSEVTIMLSRSQLGRLIGSKGATVQAVQDEFNVRINALDDAVDKGPGQVPVKITGQSYDVVTRAAAAIQLLVQTGSTKPNAPATVFEATVDFPRKYISEALGPQGVRKQAICHATETKIEVPRSDGRGNSHLNGTIPFHITGKSQENVDKAVAILEELKLFHCSKVTHPSSFYQQMDVPKKYLSRIVGVRGITVTAMERRYDVQMYLPGLNPKMVVVGSSDEAIEATFDEVEGIMDQVDAEEKLAEEIKAEQERKAAEIAVADAPSVEAK